MNFTSQICTTEEQSKRLIALGLKAETADMSYQVKYRDPFSQHLVDCTPSLLTYPPINNERFIPAWSLHRLIEMMPKRIANLKENWDMCGHDITFVITEDLDVNYEEPFEDEPCYNKYFYKGNLYDKIVDSIAWLIQKGYFYQEYLEEQL